MMMDYSLENLHVLLEQEMGAYATYDYLRMTSSDSWSTAPKEEGEEEPGESPSNDDDPAPTGSALHNLGTIVSSCSRKRKRIAVVVADDTDIAFIKARSDREVWRQRVCTWCYAVVDHIGMSREVVSVAMNLLDRYSAMIFEETSSWISDGALHALFKHDFQLTSMGCLFIASKLYDRHHPMLKEKASTLACLVHMTQRSCSEQQLAVKEKDILTTLYWKVHPPTPQAFASLLAYQLKHSTLKLISTELEDLAAYLIELSVTDYFFVSFKPSEVALASLLYALELRLFPRKILEILPQLLPFPLTPGVMECGKRLEYLYRSTCCIMDGGGAPSTSSSVVDAVPDVAPSMASPVTVTSMDL